MQRSLLVHAHDELLVSFICFMLFVVVIAAHRRMHHDDFISHYLARGM